MAALFSRRLSARATRRLTIVALLATVIALLLCLQFVYRTTVGTLFLFSTLSPVLVMVAIFIVVGITVHEYRLSHELFTVERFSAGTTIFRQGDPGDRAYFIRDGEVEVFDEERGQVLARLAVGDYFGEMALIANAPRNATVRAVSDVELAALGKHNFLNMLKLLPSTQETIMSTVQQRAMRSRASD
jgi:CRP-like cAMP-binding protein